MLSIAADRLATVRREEREGRRRSVPAHQRGRGRTSARLYGLIETEKANGIEPWAYLRHVFDAMPRATSPEEIEALVPQNVDPELIRHPASTM